MTQNRKRTDMRTLCIIAGILLLGCLLAFQSYLLGNETLVFSDVGSDTIDQYIMYYNSIVNHLRAGDFSLWDFTNGLGADMFIMNLTAPFLLVVYFLGFLFGPENLTFYMIYVLVAEIVLAGVTCYFYLSEFPLEERYKLPACLMYGFNGYLISWGQHYQLGGVVVFLPLLLMCIEKTFQKKRAFLGVAFTSGLLILNGFYQGYMCMLGGGIYVAFRVLLLWDAPWKKRFQKFGALALSMTFGVALGAVNLLPAASAQAFQTNRLSSSLSLWERIVNALAPWKTSYYETLLYRLFGENLQGKGSYFYGYKNYYEAPNIFFSTLFLVLLVQYLFAIRRQEKTRLQKFAQYLAVLVSAFLLLVPLGSMMFNGFAYPFSRHTFLFMPLFALISAWELQQILRDRRYSMAGLILSAAGIAAVYALAYRYTDAADGKGNVLRLCLTGLGMVFLLLVMLKKKNADLKICYLALVSLLFVNLVSDTSYGFTDRDTLRKNYADYYEETYESSVQDALYWIASQDDSFYRVEKDFQTASGGLDSMAQDYMGVSTYNSTRSKSYTSFVRTLWPQMLTGYDGSHYYFTNALREHVLASLTGVKYLLSKSGDLNLPGYELFHQTGDIYIYRNTETDSIGKFYVKTISEETHTEIWDELDTWSLLREVLVVDGESDYEASEEDLAAYQKQTVELLKEEELTEGCSVTEEGIETDEQEFALSLDTETLAQYEDVSMKFTLEMSAGSEITITMDGQSPCVRYHNKGKQTYSFVIPEGTKSVEFSIKNGGIHTIIRNLTFTGATEKSEFLDQSGICIDAPETDGHLTGTITAPEDGMVLLAIPCDSGWSVYLNGEEQEIKEGDYGLICFEVKEGEYEFEAVYHAPLFREGAAISLVSLLLFMILYVISGFRKRKEIV